MTELEKQQFNAVIMLVAQKIGELYDGMNLFDEAFGVLDDRLIAAEKTIVNLRRRVETLEVRLAQPSDFR